MASVLFSLPSLVKRVSALLMLCVVILTVGGCGSGSSSGGGGTQQPPSAPDFTLVLSSANVTITKGGTATISVSVNAVNGFKSAVTLSITGLPKGITFSPATLQASPGSSLQITFSAASTAGVGSATVTVAGGSGLLTHGSQFGLTVLPAQVAAPSFRTRYTRTDAATEYFTEPNGNWMVFDPPTKRFFVSDPSGNQIDVLDATNEAKVGSIAVPGAYGIDEAPDHSVLYAATQIGDVYAINPVTMQVTQRYVAAQIGPSGFQAFQVRVLANGELALLGGQGGLPGVDGYGSVGLWNPSTNALTVYNKFSHIGAFTLTGDRSLIVVGGIVSPGSFCTLDPGTGNVACANANNLLYSVATTPDGKSILLPDYDSGQVVVFDAKTLTQTAAFTVKGDLSSAASMIVSPDSKTLYMESGGGFLYAYDLASGAQVGWLPTLTVEPKSGGGMVGPIAPDLQAFDNTGLLAGPMEEGVGFLDTAALKTGPVGSEFLNDYLVPATGPAAGGTATEWGDLSSTAEMGAAYFGGNLATSISQGSGQFYGATPSGTPGPVDLYAVMADGGTLIVPEGFSYGPTILEVTSDAATAEGGGNGIIYGYGFGSTANNAPMPTDLQIAIGGKLATVTGFVRNAYGTLSPPFNLQAVAYTIPPGVAGTTADVAVTTAAGTTTASAALKYLPAIQQFPLQGAILAQGIHDATRDLYYFTDASQIQVFSRSKGQWLTPIQVPAPPSGTTHRLWGIALSQDGSKLAVSDESAGMIYLINPDSPGSAQSFPVSTYFAGFPYSYPGVKTEPAGLAVSNSGMVYFAAFMVGGYDGFFKLDTNTGHVTDYGIQSFGNNQLRVAITADNSRVFFNEDGFVFDVDTSSDKVTYASTSPGCCRGDYDLTISASQNTVEATSYLYDTSLNAESYLALNDREGMNINYIYGAKLSADGRMLFLPSTNGIDVFDGRLGKLLKRISLPVALSQNFDALVSNGVDNVLIAITGQTGSGIAIIDLTSLAEPAPLPYEARSSDRVSAPLQDSRESKQINSGKHAVVFAGQHIPITVVKRNVDGTAFRKPESSRDARP